MEVLLIILFAPLALALGGTLLWALGALGLGAICAVGSVAEKTSTVVERITPWGWYCLTLGLSIYLLIGALTGWLR